MRSDPSELRLEVLGVQVEALTGRLDDLQRRLERLEAGDDAAGEVEAIALAEGDAVAPGQAISGLPSLAKIVALVGRTLVVLGGAYLLRAVSDEAVIPPLWGAAAALAYAVWWLLQVPRAAEAGQRASASFHGVAAMMIAFPLVWETTARFEFVPVPLAAGVLVVFCAMGLAVSWRRELWEISWAVCLLTLLTALSLFLGTHAFLPFTVALLLIAALVEVVAFRDRWLGLRWPAALALDLAVLMTITSALRPDPPPEGFPVLPPAGVITVALALPALYLASVAARTLLRGHPVTPFEMTQAMVALLVGCGGAVRLVEFIEGDPSGIGLALLPVGAVCYVAAFSFIDRRSGRGRNFYCYGSFAGLLILAGTYMALGGAAAATIWSVLAIAAVVLGRRYDRITLRLHGACYVVAAATVTGLLGCAYDGLLADPAADWQPLSALAAGVVLVAAASFWVLIPTRGGTGSRWVGLLPQFIVGGVLAWSLAGMAASWLAGLLAVAPGESADPALLAAGRTAVIALLAVALAWSGRRWSLLELTWLAYPVLVGGFAKLFWQDLRYGEPRALFLALAIYGAALIVAPRLLKTET